MTVGTLKHGLLEYIVKFMNPLYRMKKRCAGSITMCVHSSMCACIYSNKDEEFDIHLMYFVYVFHSRLILLKLYHLT